MDGTVVPKGLGVGEETPRRFTVGSSRLWPGTDGDEPVTARTTMSRKMPKIIELDPQEAEALLRSCAPKLDRESYEFLRSFLTTYMDLIRSIKSKKATIGDLRQRFGAGLKRLTVGTRDDR